jgi:D-mannonate dehydratase
MTLVRPKDGVTLRDAHEAGATGIVTALHEVPMGEVWPVEHIRQRQQEIQRGSAELRGAFAHGRTLSDEDGIVYAEL